nr:Gfo/Idh/MocA family oxidoreductase [Caldilineaceae bacterium]
MINVAVLGAGFMGETHARAFARIPDVRVIGVSSRSADKSAALAQAVGAEPFTDAMALLHDPRVDAVSITLPTHVHANYTIAALRAGKHVLVEKPLALTLAECDAMIAAAAEANRVLMVAHVLRFWPEYMAIADLLQRSELGKPLTATAIRLCTPPTWGEWFKY